MGIITAISEHASRRGRFTIEIDGERAAVVGVEAVADLSLSVGVQLDPSARRALDLASRRTALLDKALDLLAIRGRSRRDLQLRLRRTKADAADITWVATRLETLGYLDDAAYARQVARSRIVEGGASKRRVQDELYRRGVAREVAAEAIEATLEEVGIDEYSAALAAAERRVRALTKLDPPTRRRRLYAFLARRGYAPDVVSRVVREVLDPDR